MTSLTKKKKIDNNLIIKKIDKQMDVECESQTLQRRTFTQL